jgi:predicted dehydrogenase
LKIIVVETIRWGVISTANIGQKRVIPAIQTSNNGSVTAISSRSLQRAEEAAKQLGIPKAYGSYEELISDPNIDAIYNPLPNSEHAIWSIRCAEAGKPTLCEKPLASNAVEAQTIIDAFADRNVLFAEAFMYRFHPQTQRAKQLVQSGELGEIHVIQATFTFCVRDENNVRLSKALAGGSLMDVGCYCVNLMRFILEEEPSAVHAFADVGKDSQVDETLTGIMTFPSGVMGHFDCGLRTYRTHTYEIRGSEGRLVVPEAFVMNPVETKILHWRSDEYSEIKISAANHYQLMVEDFADAVIKDRPPRFLPQDAVNNMAVIDQLLASIR